MEDFTPIFEGEELIQRDHPSVPRESHGLLYQNIDIIITIIVMLIIYRILIFNENNIDTDKK